MSDNTWQQILFTELKRLNITYKSQQLQYLTLSIDATDWSKISNVLRGLEARFSGVWGDVLRTNIDVYALFSLEQHYLLVKTNLPEPPFSLPSISTCYPAANRMERHMRDLLGVELQDSPDDRRWTRHQAWKDKEYPLHENFPIKRTSYKKTDGDCKYPFFQTQGSSVCEVPVGPIHAGIIEPGHFRFQVIGETVLNLEQRFGYTHKGIEKIAIGKTPAQLLKLAARVSGDSSVANTWCAAMAIETASNVKVPERAIYLRAILLERERIANHIGDIGGICNDVGFAFAHHQTARLRELWQRTNAQIFNHRLLMDTIVIGGVANDINPDQIQSLLQELDTISRDFDQFIDIIQDYPSLEDRLATTGFLPHGTAKALGCLGYVGRASGIDVDVRRNNSYPPYDKYKVQHVLHSDGDVLSRLQVRVEETRSSFKLLSALLHGLASGDIVNSKITLLPNSQALGIVAAWRGEMLAFIRLDDRGNIARYYPRDPSWLNWPALEALIDDNIIADFPVCNKSVNGSYSGVDL